MNDMKNWRTYKFAEIAHNISERKMPESGDEGTYIGLEHIDTGSLHITRWGSKTELAGEKLKIREGDVLFGRRNAYLKRVGIAPFDGIFSAHGMVFRPNEHVICKEFFPFFIMSEYFMERAIQISVGSLSPTVNWGTLKKEEFSLPPIEEQRHLAELLWAADEVVSSLDAALSNAKHLLISTYHSSFYADVYGYSNNSEAIIKKIADIAHVYSGGTPKRGNPEFWENGKIPWVKTGEVNYVDIYDAEEKITNLGLEKSSAKLVPPESILVAMYGQGPTRGRVGFVKKEVAINQASAAIVPDTNLILARYLYYYLSSQYENMRRAAQGAAQPNLNGGMLKGFSVPCPSLEEQSQVVEKINAINQTIEHIANERDSMNQLIHRINNSAMGGKLGCLTKITLQNN